MVGEEPPPPIPQGSLLGISKGGQRATGDNSPMAARKPWIQEVHCHLPSPPPQNTPANRAGSIWGAVINCATAATLVLRLREPCSCRKLSGIRHQVGEAIPKSSS